MVGAWLSCNSSPPTLLRLLQGGPASGTETWEKAERKLRESSVLLLLSGAGSDGGSAPSTASAVVCSQYCSAPSPLFGLSAPLQHLLLQSWVWVSPRVNAGKPEMSSCSRDRDVAFHGKTFSSQWVVSLVLKLEADSLQQIGFYPQSSLTLRGLLRCCCWVLNQKQTFRSLMKFWMRFSIVYQHISILPILP